MPRSRRLARLNMFDLPLPCPMQGSTSCRDLSISPCLCPIPPWSSCFRVPSDSVLPYQAGSSSRVLPLHLHFFDCSDDFCFISSFHLPEPFQHSPSHNHHNQLHLSFLIELKNDHVCLKVTTTPLAVVTIGSDSPLTPATSYTVTVSACTAAGCTSSEPIDVTTTTRRPSGLSPPVFISVTTTSMDVNWQPPTDPNGEITESVTPLY